MKYTSLSATAFAFAALVIAACAGGSEAQPQGSPDPSTQDGKLDAGSDGTKICVSSCTSDSQCASSCAESTGTACCDLASKTCFKSKEAVCPKSDDGDAGDNPLPY